MALEEAEAVEGQSCSKDSTCGNSMHNTQRGFKDLQHSCPGPLPYSTPCFLSFERTNPE